MTDFPAPAEQSVAAHLFNARLCALIEQHPLAAEIEALAKRADEMEESNDATTHS